MNDVSANEGHSAGRDGSRGIDLLDVGGVAVVTRLTDAAGKYHHAGFLMNI